MIRQLFVVTHTESQHHLDHLVGGWYDSDLSAAGREQARLVAAELGRTIPSGVPVALHTSDLRRTRQTAEPIAERFGVEARSSPLLREMSYGVAEGRPQRWLDERYVPAPDDNRLDHHPGVDGAESKRRFAERIYAAMDLILADSCATQVVVTHGGTIGMIIAAWAKIPLESAGWFAFTTTPGGITHLIEDGRFRNRGVASVNRVDHLR